MTVLLLAPGANLSPQAVARTLHQPPQVQARADRDVAGIVASLWEETEHRAQRPARPWASSETPDWILASIRDFAAQLLHELSGGAPNLVAVHPGAATHIQVARRILPNTPVISLLRDGTFSPSPVRDALGGLRWAQTWAASTIEGVPCVSVERVPAAAVRGTLLAPLAGLRPPPMPQLSPEAMLGFGCWEPARAAMARAGYAAPPRPHAPPEHPALIEAYAAGEPLEAAVLLLERALKRHPDGRLWAALGERLAEAGEQQSAFCAWISAIESEQSPPSAWIALLGHPEQDHMLPHLSEACRHPDAQVRAATARWLVARGMDEEAAEAVTQVRDERWYAAAK